MPAVKRQLPLVRSVNTGISAVNNPLRFIHGRLELAGRRILDTRGASGD